MRGQIASIDLVLATITLSVLVFVLVSFLDAEMKNSESLGFDEKRGAQALFAVQQLALTPGRPDNWDSSTCERAGLSCGEGTLCAEKLSRLSTLYSSNYTLARSSLGLSAYEVSVLVCNSSSYSQCYYNLSTQERENARANSSHVSRAEAVSSLDGSAVSVIVYAWE